MPIEKDEEEIEVTKTKTTKRYVCDVDDCDEYSENWDPKDDGSDRDHGHGVGHNIHFVALNPYKRTKFARGTSKPTLDEQVGLYLCENHLDRAGELIVDRLSAFDPSSNHE